MLAQTGLATSGLRIPEIKSTYSCIGIYTHAYINVYNAYAYIHKKKKNVYIYIYRKRERERETDVEREREKNNILCVSDDQGE